MRQLRAVTLPVAGLDDGNPAGAVRVLVNQFGRFFERRVDLDDRPGHRRLDRHDRFAQLPDTHRLALLDLVTHRLGAAHIEVVAADLDTECAHAHLHAAVTQRAAPHIVVEVEIAVVRIVEAEDDHRSVSNRKHGGRMRESNPPGDAWRHQLGLKPSRPTRDDFLPQIPHSTTPKRFQPS